MLEFLVGIASLLATWSQQGQQCFVDEHSAIIAECLDDLPENNWLTKRVLRSVVRRRDPGSPTKVSQWSIPPSIFPRSVATGPLATDRSTSELSPA